MANPVEYLQEKARRSTSVPLLKSHLPHARRSGGEEQRNKSATACTAKSHPTNLPTLQSAYSNRPTVCRTPRRERSKRSASRQQVATNRMPETALLLLLQCPHTYHHMPSSSSIIPRANHQQIKQHHNHQSTSHPPHHRHHPSSTISSSRRRHSPGQQQPPAAGEEHTASPRFSKRSPHIKEIIISGKRICRFSAAAPSAQSIESPRSRPANET